MTSGSPSSFLNDQDLNGLVDGLLEAKHQSELLRRLKSHPAEAAQVAALREQNDLLRATFSEVENEPVPLSLRLTPPPKLRCVSDAEDERGIAAIVEDRPSGMRYRAVAGSCVLIVGVVVGCWAILTRPMLDATPRKTGSPIVETVSDLGPDSAISVVDAASAQDTPNGDLPLSTIPNLAETGFRFAGAIVPESKPSTVVFSYRNDAAESLTLSVTRTSQTESDTQAAGLHAVTWRRGGRSYALTGLADTTRLTSIAALIRAAGDGNAVEP